MLRSNHLVQTVRTTFPVVQTVPITFPLGISHLHLWIVETVFLSQFAPLGKRWRRLTENIVLSLFNFVQRALVFEDYPCVPALLVRGFVSNSREKGTRSMGEEKKEGKTNNNNKLKVDR